MLCTRKSNLPKRSPSAANKASICRVLRDVALAATTRDVQLGGERADALFAPAFPGTSAPTFGAFGPQHLCDAPGDAPLVGDAQERRPSFHSISPAHVSCLLAASRLCEAASPPHVVRGDASTRGPGVPLVQDFGARTSKASISCEFGGGMGVKIASFICEPCRPCSGRSCPSVWHRLVAPASPSSSATAVVTQVPHDAGELAQEAAGKGFQAVIAVGGRRHPPRSVNGAAQSVYRIPAVGSSLQGRATTSPAAPGSPARPRAGPRGLPAGWARSHRRGTVNDRVFINVAGFGFDAAVAEEVIRRSVEAGRGGPGAIRSICLWPFTSLSAPSVRPRNAIDRGRHESPTPLLFGAVGNGSTYGGGMKICPHAPSTTGSSTSHRRRPGPGETLTNLARVFLESTSSPEMPLPARPEGACRRRPSVGSTPTASSWGRCRSPSRCGPGPSGFS